MDGAQTALTRLHRFFLDELGEQNGKVVRSYQKYFHEAVNDDLDTPKAISLLWKLIKDEKIPKSDKRATLLDFDKVLGFGLVEGSRKLKRMLRDEEKRIEVTKAPDEVQKLLADRNKAREERNWEEADRLRDEIEKQGYKIEDSEKGPELRSV